MSDLKLRELLLKRVLMQYSIDNKCKNSDSTIDITDNFVNDIISILDKHNFNAIEESEQYAILGRLLENMSKYVGVSEVDCELQLQNKAMTGLTPYEYSQVAKFMSTEEKLDFLMQNVVQEDGVSNPNNEVEINFYTKRFYDDLRQKFKLTQNEIDILYTNVNYVATLRHEFQHIFQFGKMTKYFNREKVEEKYKIFALFAMMENSLFAIKGDDFEDDNGEMESDEIGSMQYFFNPLEIDARFSEIMLEKKLIEDDRIPQHLKKDIENYMLDAIDYNYFCLKDNSLRSYVEAYMKMIKTQFKKEFGAIPLGETVLKEFDKCNLEKYFNSLDRQEDIMLNLEACSLLDNVKDLNLNKKKVTKEVSCNEVGKN
ncbi:MAG: hypothetical protein ACI4TX_00135 [Christensenellales bacterium]